MDNLFLLLFLVCMIAIFIGIINPKFVIRWGNVEKKNRVNVFKYYGIAFIISLIMIGMTTPDTTLQSTKEITTAFPEITETPTATEDRIAEEAKLAEKKKLEEEKKAEEERLAEEKRIAEEKKAEKLRLAEEKKAEELRLAEEKKAEELRLAEEKKVAEKKKAEEARLAEEKRVRETKLAEEKKEQQQEVTVYITKTGECYHRSGCQYLRRSKIPINLDDAKRNYRACSRCNPPN